MTEKVTQEVKLSGITFDKEKLMIERAKIIAEMETAAMDHEEQLASGQNNRPGYNEKGMKSNNA